MLNKATFLVLAGLLLVGCGSDGKSKDDKSKDNNENRTEVIEIVNSDSNGNTEVDGENQTLNGLFELSQAQLVAVNESLNIAGVSYSDLSFDYTDNTLTLDARCETDDGAVNIYVQAPITVSGNTYEVLEDERATEFVGNSMCFLEIKKGVTSFKINGNEDLELTEPDGSKLTLKNMMN